MICSREKKKITKVIFFLSRRILERYSGETVAWPVSYSRDHQGEGSILQACARARMGPRALAHCKWGGASARVTLASLAPFLCGTLPRFRAPRHGGIRFCALKYGGTHFLCPVARESPIFVPHGVTSYFCAPRPQC